MNEKEAFYEALNAIKPSSPDDVFSSDPVVLTNHQITVVRMETRADDYAPWADTIAFARAVIDANAEAVSNENEKFLAWFAAKGARGEL